MPPHPHSGLSPPLDQGFPKTWAVSLGQRESPHQDPSLGSAGVILQGEESWTASLSGLHTLISQLRLQPAATARVAAFAVSLSCPGVILPLPSSGNSVLASAFSSSYSSSPSLQPPSLLSRASGQVFATCIPGSGSQVPCCSWDPGTPAWQPSSTRAALTSPRTRGLLAPASPKLSGACNARAPKVRD